MYLTMNRFKVKPDPESQAAFEEIWLSRESKLTQVPGFVEFHMLRGPQGDDYRLYCSHTMWESKEAFEAWTTSDAFRSAHAGAGRSKQGTGGEGGTEGEAKARPSASDLMVDRNALEVFESFQHIKA